VGNVRNAAQVRSAADIAAELQQIVQSISGAPTAQDQPLMEAGVDSLGAVELRNALGARFGIDDLPATLVFDYPTIAALAQYLAAAQPSSSLSAAPPPLATMPAARAKDAAWLARASEVAGMSCRYPGSSDGETQHHATMLQCCNASREIPAASKPAKTRAQKVCCQRWHAAAQEMTAFFWQPCRLPGLVGLRGRRRGPAAQRPRRALGLGARILPGRHPSAHEHVRAAGLLRGRRCLF
jgi:acyl carrier protein